jgi:hypothetical protein
MGALLPPSQYDHPPTIPVVERIVQWDELQKLCHTVIVREKFSTATGHGAWGCAGIVGGKCYVFRLDMPDVARHELAHCNGWPSDHPGGYYEFNK